MYETKVAEPEPRHFGGTGAGAATQCGSESKISAQRKWIIKNVTNYNVSFFSIQFQNNLKQKNKPLC
jgi:hypothetical protein